MLWLVDPKEFRDYRPIYSLIIKGDTTSTHPPTHTHTHTHTQKTSQ